MLGFVGGDYPLVHLARVKRFRFNGCIQLRGHFAMKLFAIDVFTPNQFPEHTYIERPTEDLEGKLTRALATPNVVTSLSGPSKSGKTVLAKKLVGEDNLIHVFGAEVRSGAELWERVLSWMDAPSSVSEQSSESRANKFGAEVGGKGSILIAEASGKGSFDTTGTKTNSVTATKADASLSRIVREIGNSGYVVFLDDFHYIPADSQVDVARQIKAGSERGIKICTATVPHRADNVVRNNPELRGRLAQVDTTFWSASELAEIAKSGFAKLQVNLPVSKMMDLAREACGSPQLMQRICLDVCFTLKIDKEMPDLTEMDISPQQLGSILQQSSTHADFGTLVANLHKGPKERGSERRVHELIDGTHGDVYRVILTALAHGAPVMELPYSDLKERIENVCVGEGPSASSVVQSCRQIANIARRIAQNERVLEWDDQELTGTMSIVDPYFLFYLRRSKKLESLAN
ncbi:hypothetical protein KUL72_24885 [Bradyrhizobium arachidis]|uniref:hypothetical protein n=1 Tax=Bradyrhizobium arachidis TaxID=858423 RepID=UPI0021626B04|nr:hypothetical protein [Bradyrhizobium arachidis]UVO34688.1 hypothetical protein KUL72_24885 [Bradyrhizobium arachidis]